MNRHEPGSGRPPEPALNSPRYDAGRLAAVGTDVFISAAVEIRRPHLVRVGNHVAIDSGFYCTVGADIGDYVHVGPSVIVIGGAKALWSVGHFATIAAGSRMVCASDEFMGEGFTSVTVPEKYRDRVICEPIRIGRFAGVGSNVVVLPGVTLGEGSVVGACSLVTQDTEPWTIYTGVPARPRKARRKDRMLEMAKKLGYNS